jgi:photosystem II stability/assembly factor-like uncharacterized protein
MQHRFFPASPSRTVGALILGAAFCLAPAAAAIDLLTLPALQSPKAAKGTLLAIASAGDRLVAAGERGIIVYSDDQGASWKQARVPVSVTLTTLFFASREVGWAAGHDGVIVRTTDAGTTWHKQFDGNAGNALILADLKARLAAAQGNDASTRERLENALADAESSSKFGPSLPLLGLWFGDADNGLAVGAFGQLFQTIDGGKSWATLSARISNPEGLHFNSIAKVGDGSLVIAGEGGKLRRSRDRGASWETLDTGYTGHLYGALAPAGSGKIIAFGFGGTVLVSGDNGKNWQRVPKRVNKAIVSGVVLPDGAVVLAAGDGHLLVSRDQGANFDLIEGGAGGPVAALLSGPLATGQLLAVGRGGARTLALGAKAP